jgi:hypothetical protein
MSTSYYDMGELSGGSVYRLNKWAQSSYDMKLSGRVARNARDVRVRIGLVAEAVVKYDCDTC